LQRRRRGYVTLSPRFGPDSHITGTGDIYNRRKRREGRPGKDDKLPQLEAESRTSEVVAEEVGTSRASVERAGEFAQVLEVIREDDDDAIDWLRKNQLGKRNLTENQQAFLIGDLYNRRKRKDGGHGDQKSEGKVCTPNMAEVVAEEIQVSPRTVKNAGEFAQVLEVIREDDDDEPLFFREDTVKFDGLRFDENLSR